MLFLRRVANKTSDARSRQSNKPFGAVKAGRGATSADDYVRACSCVIEVQMDLAEYSKSVEELERVVAALKADLASRQSDKPAVFTQGRIASVQSDMSARAVDIVGALTALEPAERKAEARRDADTKREIAAATAAREARDYSELIKWPRLVGIRYAEGGAPKLRIGHLQYTCSATKIIVLEQIYSLISLDSKTNISTWKKTGATQLAPYTGLNWDKEITIVPYPVDHIGDVEDIDWELVLSNESAAASDCKAFREYAKPFLAGKVAHVHLVDKRNFPPNADFQPTFLCKVNSSRGQERTQKFEITVSAYDMVMELRYIKGMGINSEWAVVDGHDATTDRFAVVVLDK